jgi:DNA repair/transcription protein MET18/MMS19
MCVLVGRSDMKTSIGHMLEQHLIDVFTDPQQFAEHKGALNNILITVQSRRVPLIQVVQQLENQLVHSNEKIRSRGILLLAEVLTRLPSLSLNPREIDTLVTFFSERLRDTACVPPVLQAISALGKHHLSGLPVTAASRFLSAIFEQVTVQGLVQSVRKQVYEVFAFFCLEARSHVIDMGSTFIKGFIAAMDGEKDPRNLVLCFALARFTLISFPEDQLAPNIEELFEITACYFPITFAAVSRSINIRDVITSVFIVCSSPRMIHMALLGMN